MTALRALRPPDEPGASERAWAVVAAAFADREAVPRDRGSRRVLVVALAAAALAAGLLSPPGQAFVDRIRRVVGIDHAAPALFSLPAPGRLLVTSDVGSWIVTGDGAKRLLGPYREASWSPYGRFVAAAGRSELAALEPGGKVRWTLSRPAVARPRWSGTPSDTRIAYLSAGRLRLVAGDGTGDAAVGAATAAPVAPAWRPGAPFELVYVTGAGRLAVLGKGGWQTEPRVGRVRKLAWSDDGQRLLVVGARTVRIFDAAGRTVGRDAPPAGERNVDAAFLPGSHTVVVLRAGRDGSALVELASGRVLFAGSGRFGQVVPAPDGSRLLVTWPTADQWVFVPVRGGGVSAVAGVAAQFRSRTAPRVEGWSRG